MGRACGRIKFHRFCDRVNESMKVRLVLDLVCRSPASLPNFMAENSSSTLRCWAVCKSRFDWPSQRKRSTKAEHRQHTILQNQHTTQDIQRMPPLGHSLPSKPAPPFDALLLHSECVNWRSEQP